MAARGLKDYLQRYVDKPEADGGKAKTKKKKRKGKGGGSIASQGVIIVDNDSVWHRDRKADEEEDEPDEEGEGPTVIEDVEVKRMHRMEAMKTHRPYLSMADDGSGWVTVNDDEEAVAVVVAASAAGDGDTTATISPRGNSPDLSPRRRRNDSPDLSPPRRRNGSSDLASGREDPSEDVSPPRRPKSVIGGDLSSPRRRRDSPEDVSPPRRPKSFIKGDLSPPRRRRDSPEEASPPRRPKSFIGGDLSPPRRRRDSLEEASPPRRPKSFVGADLSPPRRRGNSLEDNSPPRRPKSFAGGNSSPSRKRRDSANVSPSRRRHDSPPNDSARLPTKRRRMDSPDLSPPRRRKGSPDVRTGRKVESKDLSPPRKPRGSMGSPKQNRSEDLSPPRKKGSARMADGAFAGLKTDRQVVSEAERKRAAEAKMLAELDPSLSGRGAETVFRDKRGRRLEGLEEMLRQQRGEAKPAEQPLEWGKGLAQKKVADENLAELEAEKSKPFARYRDDADLDKSLKERLRWGDPMAHLVKQTAEPVLEDLGAREEMRASGFIVPQDIPKHSWLKRGMAPPPNRYDIRPGRHWDGVDRSTGFEQGMFKSKNEKKARDLEAYLWSVSDM